MDNNHILKPLQESAQYKQGSVLIANLTPPIAFETEIISVGVNSIIIKNTVSIELISKVLKAPSFTFSTLNITISNARIESYGENFILSYSDEDTQSSLIKFNHFTNSRYFKIHFQNPYDPKTVLSKDILGLDSEQVYFSNFSDLKAIELDLSITSATIQSDNQVLAQCHGTINLSMFLSSPRNFQDQLLGLKGHISLEEK